MPPIGIVHIFPDFTADDLLRFDKNIPEIIMPLEINYKYNGSAKQNIIPRVRYK